MKKNFLLVLILSSFAVLADAWIGDGRQELKDAEFYADEGAPVFVAQFTADGDVGIEIAVAGYYWIEINGGILNVESSYIAIDGDVVNTSGSSSTLNAVYMEIKSKQ